MNRQRTEMKAELMAAAEAVMDELLQWDAVSPAPTLSEIEAVVLKLRQRLSARMAEVVVNGQEAARPVPGPVCPRCGREMHHKGVKTSWVESRAGRLKLERVYYYCEHCAGGGFFPSGPAIAVMGEELE